MHLCAKDANYIIALMMKCIRAASATIIWDFAKNAQD
jgi:hypothetical protein